MLVPLLPGFKEVRTGHGVHFAMMRCIAMIVIVIMSVIVIVIVTVIIIMVVIVSMVMAVVMAQQKRHEEVHTDPAGSCDEHEPAVDRIGIVCQSGCLHGRKIVRSYVKRGDTATCAYLWIASYTRTPVIIQINCMETNAPRICFEKTEYFVLATNHIKNQKL